MEQGEEPGRTQRLDKWLWHGRFLKTRGLASRLISGGMVRVNREKVVKPSHTVRAGDVITATIAGRVRVVRVVGFGERRGPPSEARRLYEDILTEVPGSAAGNARARQDAPEEPAD
jgi:ribosome-associated heat shock protein Hsp15